MNGSLRNPASGRCLDVPGSVTADGTQLKIWDCTGGANQTWQTPAVPAS
ncbi:RICIN domain-containing protein [Streptomyces sp. M10(2022)]